MSLLGALSRTPLVDQRGMITREWFRYLTGANPTSGGTVNQVLHGNDAGAYPTWGPVDLAADTTGEIDLTSQVSGELPVANGGLGGLARTPGGVPFFPDASSIASSAFLQPDWIVFGGGVSGPQTPVGGGTSHGLLHGNAFGLPSWMPVDLTAEVTGLLPRTSGGTGTTGGTGTGSVVYDSGAIISPLQILGGQWQSAHIKGNLFWDTGTTPPSSQIDWNDSGKTTVATGPATLIGDDGPVFWIVYDKTSGGMALGTMDPTVGLHQIYNGMTSVTFSRAAGVGLQVTIGAAPTTRTFSAGTILMGPP